jgi:2-C-methyl-D-erythritol 2,4-cyclodiphosphate synthase
VRIGQGIDAHRFGEGRPLVLGGVRIDFELGLEAHSDGDVLLHALCDALLGAAGLGDIGRHFPDSDAEFKNVDSRLLLRQVVLLLHQAELSIQNVDLTLVAQRPRMSPHVDAMVENIAHDLQVPLHCVNVKATTTERMGFTGREEGIAAFAIVLLDEPRNRS